MASINWSVTALRDLNSLDRSVVERVIQKVQRIVFNLAMEYKAHLADEYGETICGVRPGSPTDAKGRACLVGAAVSAGRTIDEIKAR